MIAETLASYSAACDRASIESRPTVWADHFDIWNTERGEIGLLPSNPDGRSTAVFAALIPFALVPEISNSVLVLNLSGLAYRELAVIRLSVSSAGIEVTHCRVPFGIGDDGVTDFGNVKDGLSSFVSTRVLAAVDRIADGRRERFAWDEAFSFDASVRVAEEFVRALTDIP